MLAIESLSVSIAAGVTDRGLAADEGLAPEAALSGRCG
jgi:hypothetical protein